MIDRWFKVYGGEGRMKKRLVDLMKSFFLIERKNKIGIIS